MLNKFLQSVITESLRSATTTDFFKKADQVKTSFPTEIGAYLTSTSEKDFLRDTHQIIKLLNKEKGLDLSDNKFLESILSYLCVDLGATLDSLDSKFYLSNRSNQEKTLSELIKEKHTLVEPTIELILSSNYKSLLKETNELATKIGKNSYIVVQTPRETNKELKKSIREKLQEKYGKTSLPMFAVNQNIIGGLRVFVDGEVTDHSWLGKINYITSII